MTTIYPRPWRIERKANTACVIDAKGEPIPMLNDIELGWTDTSTGNYHDPESEYAVLEEIVGAINDQEKMNDALSKALNALNEASSVIEGL